MTDLAPRLITAPAELPVSLAEAKARVRVDFSDDDADALLILRAAVARIDGYFGAAHRALVTQTWEEAFPMFSNDYLRLKVGPVASITSITYEQPDGSDAVLSASAYSIMHDMRGPIVQRSPYHSWPGTGLRRDAVRVRFVAGTAPASVPDDLKQAIILTFADWYAHRESVAIGVSASAIPIPASAQSLLFNHQSYVVA